MLIRYTRGKPAEESRTPDGVQNRTENGRAPDQPQKSPVPVKRYRPQALRLALRAGVILWVWCWEVSHAPHSARNK